MYQIVMVAAICLEARWRQWAQSYGVAQSLSSAICLSLPGLEKINLRGREKDWSALWMVFSAKWVGTEFAPSVRLTGLLHIPLEFEERPNRRVRGHYEEQRMDNDVKTLMPSYLYHTERSDGGEYKDNARNASGRTPRTACAVLRMWS